MAHDFHAQLAPAGLAFVDVLGGVERDEEAVGSGIERLENHAIPVVREILPFVDEDCLISRRARLSGCVGLQEQAWHLLPVFMPRLTTLGRRRHRDFGQTKLPRAPGVKREDLKPVVSAERPGQVLGQDAIEAQYENAPIRMQLP